MNWGKGLAIAMGMFIIFIMTMVVKMMSTNTDLVEDDYYKKDVAYQNEINALKRANHLEEKINIKQTEQHIVVEIPSSIHAENVTIKFRRINNAKQDKIINIEEMTSLINKDNLEKGRYNLVIEYEIDNQQYLQKESIYIQ